MGGWPCRSGTDALERYPMAKPGMKHWARGGVLAAAAVVLVAVWGPGGCGSGAPTGTLSPGVSGLYFAADDGVAGREPWILRGPSLSPELLADINGAGGDSDPQSFARISDTVYFTADDGSGRELWETDGTTSGTEEVSTFSASGGAIPDGTELTVYNGDLYFAADDGSTGTEPWFYDVSLDQVKRIEDINTTTGTASSNPTRFTVAGGTLFFTATNGNEGVELWKTDGTGTDAGTKQVQDLFSGSTGSNPTFLADRNGVLYFQATDGTSGRDLYSSDGTIDSISRVANIDGGSADSNPAHMTAFNNYLYFSADRPASEGVELWRSNGTTTERIQDINSGAGDSNPHNFLVTGSRLFFAASDGPDNVELWLVASTSPISANRAVSSVDGINPSGSSNPQELANFGGTLVFQANDGSSGAEPWRSDGAGSTSRIVNLNTASGAGSTPREFTVFENQLFFTATDDGSGREIWKITSLGLAPTQIAVNRGGDYDPEELAAL